VLNGKGLEIFVDIAPSCSIPVYYGKREGFVGFGLTIISMFWEVSILFQSLELLANKVIRIKFRNWHTLCY
jgi:hypothetical protein